MKKLSALAFGSGFELFWWRQFYKESLVHEQHLARHRASKLDFVGETDPLSSWFTSRSIYF